MSTQMIIRVDDEIKSKFAKIAKAEGKSVSVVIRELIEDYIQERDIETYIDDLWARVGKKLKSNGVTAGTIQKAIREARTAKK
ncbi:MAG: ribbon-helix-helix protein, CopG family [Proteobacteria bacterium]|nr:ribbon-helix-helix protein, CopG family [Pseudomonadota bacterium]